jgi:hypothetical protein
VKRPAADDAAGPPGAGAGAVAVAEDPDSRKRARRLLGRALLGTLQKFRQEDAQFQVGCGHRLRPARTVDADAGFCSGRGWGWWARQGRVGWGEAVGMCGKVVSGAFWSRGTGGNARCGRVRVHGGEMSGVESAAVGSAEGGSLLCGRGCQKTHPWNQGVPWVRCSAVQCSAVCGAVKTAVLARMGWGGARELGLVGSGGGEG